MKDDDSQQQRMHIVTKVGDSGVLRIEEEHLTMFQNLHNFPRIPILQEALGELEQDNGIDRLHFLINVGRKTYGVII